MIPRPTSSAVESPDAARLRGPCQEASVCERAGPGRPSPQQTAAGEAAVRQEAAEQEPEQVRSAAFVEGEVRFVLRIRPAGVAAANAAKLPRCPLSACHIFFSKQ